MNFFPRQISYLAVLSQLTPLRVMFWLFFLFLEKYVVKAQCVVKKHEHEISRTWIPHWLLIFDLVGENGCLRRIAK